MPHEFLVGVRGDGEATLAELSLYGLGRAFLEQFDLDVLNAQCQAVTDEAFSRMAPVVVPPLTAWGSDIRSAVGKILAYELKSLRGLSPMTGAVGDENLLVRAQQARDWLDGVGDGDNVPQDLVDASDGETSAAIPEGDFGEAVSDEPRGW